MSNLLPPESQKKVRNDMRARFLLAFSLVLFCSAALCALALSPAEASLVFFSPPPAQATQAATDTTQDKATIAGAQALLSAMEPFSATSSLADVSEALSELGTGVTVNDITYSIAARSLTLAGDAQTPDQLNSLRQSLQSDPMFSNVSVPVSALLGSQGGGFTITMNVTQ